jgi:lipoprotein signal peptidase
MEWWNILPPQIWSSISFCVDVIVVCGACMALIHFFFKERKEEGKEIDE